MKKLLIVVVILLALGGGGYYLYSNQMQKSGSATQQSGGVFGSIKDALSKSLSLQCSFDTEDGTKVAAWMKAGAVRVDSDAKDAQQSGSYIMKNNKLYFWQKGAKEGTMMEFSEPSVTPGKTQEAEPTGSAAKDNQGDNVLGMLEKFKDKCKPAVVGDDLFTPPAGVKFTDFSKLVPTGAAGGQPSEQDIQKMMQQYQQGQ